MLTQPAKASASVAARRAPEMLGHGSPVKRPGHRSLEAPPGASCLRQEHSLLHAQAGLPAAPLEGDRHRPASEVGEALAAAHTEWQAWRSAWVACRLPAQGTGLEHQTPP